MEKQIKLARMWDAARNIMARKQYARPEARAERFRALARHLKAEGLWLNAAVGTGTPALLGMSKEADGKKLVLSDGDAAFLQVLAGNYPGWEAHCALWQNLPSVFGKGAMSAVEITGNSLPYAAGWDGSRLSQQERKDALEEAIAAVFAVLEKGGKFIFDLALYRAGRTDIGWQAFLDVKYRHGARLWTVGVKNEKQTRQGLILDIGKINEILSKVGFGRARQVPKELWLDPLYYGLSFAEK